MTLSATAAPTMTFDEAAAKIQNIKGCPKKLIANVYSASLLPPGSGAKGIYIEVSDSEYASATTTFGPLKEKPTKAQLDSLKGKKTCAAAD